MTNKRSRRIVLGAGAAVLLVGAAAFGWHFSRIHSVVSIHLPAKPDTPSWPNEFSQRVASADEKARGWLPGVPALVELSRLYHANGFFAEAESCYRGLIKLEPRNPRWPYLLANILAGSGHLEEALPLLRASLALDPGYPAAQLSLAESLLKTNQAPAAVAVYDTLLKQAPTNVHALLGLAQCGLQTQDWPAALNRLHQAVTINPDFFDGWTLMVSVHEHFGNEDAAAQARRRALFCPPSQAASDPWSEALNDDCYDAYRVSVAAAATPDKAKARMWHARAIELGPANGSFRRHLGKLYLEDKNYPVARRLLEKAAELNPEDSDAWAYLVKALIESGDVAAADAALNAGLAKCPQSAALHYAKGQQLHARGQLESAVVELKASKKLAPSEPRAYIDLAMVYFRQQRLEEGMAELKATLAIDPGHPLAMQILARNSMQENDPTAAQHWIRELRRHARGADADLTMLENEYRQQFGRAP